MSRLPVSLTVDYSIGDTNWPFRFASPVRWIETQDVLFTHAKFERLIEVGPSPVLSGEYPLYNHL